MIRRNENYYLQFSDLHIFNNTLSVNENAKFSNQSERNLIVSYIN